MLHKDGKTDLSAEVFTSLLTEITGTVPSIISAYTLKDESGAHQLAWRTQHSEKFHKLQSFVLEKYSKLGTN